jgi:predicted dehydrogenase
MSDRPVNVAVIGCGRIGTQWDSPASDLPQPMTHASAFTRNPGSRLVAVCDSDAARAEAAAARWGCLTAYDNPRKMFGCEKVDLVVVATTSSARWSVIEPALSAGIKFFVIEKPIATTLRESSVIASALAAAGARALVNFSRHWDPAMRDLRARILAGNLGALQRLIGLYGKGIANNGSHMIDLVATLCAAKPVRVRSLGSPLPLTESSWSEDAEPALDAQLVIAGATGAEIQLDLLGTDQSAFTCFELRIIGTVGACSITAGGRALGISRIIDDPDFAGYKMPGPLAVLPARAAESMQAMAAEAIELVRGRIEHISCDVACALMTAATVDAVRRSEAENGRWVGITSVRPDGL